MRVYKKSLTRAILFALEKAIDGYVTLEHFAYHHYEYFYGMPEVKKSALSQALKRLRENGLIQEIKLKNDVILKLTQAGKDLVSEGQEEKNWDGKYRVVIFDIPEEKRIIRNLFRRNLKKWGFKYLQKSVWISKRNVFEKLENYIKDLGIERWVTVMEVNRLTGSII